MSAAIRTLEARAADLKEKVDFQVSSLRAHEQGALKQAREALKSEEATALSKASQISLDKQELEEIRAAIRALS